LNSYNRCSLRYIDLSFYLNKKLYGKESYKASLQAKSISVRFADFSNPSFFFTVNDFALFIEPNEKTTTKTFGKLKNGFLQSRIPIYLKSPEESAREFLSEVNKLFNENKTTIDMTIEVDVVLGIDGKESIANLYTERIDSLTYIKFDENDIMKAAKVYDVELAEKEARLIAKYPSNVPSIIKITRDAKRLSKLEKNKNPGFPEDAYRHIYWSYNLTQKLGPNLAKEITDAHETIPGNTQTERSMDYHNNEVGRKYADENISINEIKNRVLHSPAIIRHPEEVK